MFLSADIFLDCLLLLLADNSARSAGYVKSVLRIKEEEEKKRDFKAPDDALKEFYCRLTREVLATGACQNNPASMQVILLKLKSDPIKEQEPAIIDILTDILTNETKLGPKDIDTYLARIKTVLLLDAADRGLRQAYGRKNNISTDDSAENQLKAVEEVMDVLRGTIKEYEAAKTDDASKKGESYISMSDKESIRRAINTYVERSVSGVIRTGLQGVNKSLGKRNGIGLSETWVFAARSHNYKTGMLVSLMVWCVIYNTHIVPPDGKKFLVYFVSLENETYQNLIDVFKMLYCRMYKKDPGDMSGDDIIEWLHEFFSKYSIELVIDRYEPHDFTFKKFVAKVSHFEELGYVLLSFILDYMSEARGIDAGDTISSAGRLQLIGENYIKFCNFGKSRGFMTATGHQLTKEADKIAGQYRYAVKKFNASMFSYSPDVFRPVDCVHYTNIELNVDGFSFLTLLNVKNRYCKDTPVADKFCAYPFTPYGIMDDLNGPPEYVKDIDEWGIKEGSREDEIDHAALF